MTHRWPFKHVVLWSGCLLLPAACTTLPPAAPAPAATEARDKPPACLVEVFAVAMPGKSDYCRGMREWKDGHYRAGLKLLKQAAGWDSKNAQYTLGLIHYNGHHVAVNRPLGLAWLKLADERNNDAQIERITRAAFKLATPTERRQAVKLFDVMQVTYGDNVAAARAWHRLQHWRTRHGRSATGCVSLHGAAAVVARKHGLATHAPVTVAAGGASVHVSQGLTPVAQPIIGDPLWLRLKHKSTPQRTQDMQAVQQQHALVRQSLGAVCIPVQVQRQLVQRSADEYFRGLFGSVNVGPLQQVPAAASSSAH